MSVSRSGASDLRLLDDKIESRARREIVSVFRVDDLGSGIRDVRVDSVLFACRLGEDLLQVYFVRLLLEFLQLLPLGLRERLYLLAAEEV